VPLFQIKNRWNAKVLFELECGSLKLCVEAAVRANANLSAADLSAANLSAADLSAANLRAADLSAANLSAANLSAANLRAANLSAANLSDANLRDADLSAADLSAADLSDANLSAANLSAADLSDANLRAADLTAIRDDFWSVLSAAPAEVEGLRASLIAGKIDGSSYEGECACLVGTLAKVRHCDYEAIPGLKPDSSRLSERWFTGLSPGDTPETSAVAKVTLEWIDDWLGRMRAAFGSAEVVTSK